MQKLVNHPHFSQIEYNTNAITNTKTIIKELAKEYIS